MVIIVVVVVVVIVVETVSQYYTKPCLLTSLGFVYLFRPWSNTVKSARITA